MSKTVVIGLLGSTLDNVGRGADRWERWRPSVSLCQHEDFLVDRFDLLYQKEFGPLLGRTCRDIRRVSPETEIVTHQVHFDNPWDFEEVFGVLHDFSLGYDFNQEDDYLVHISTGTHVAQICLFLLTEARYFPARLIQTGPGRGRTSRPMGSYAVIDLDLSRYDRIAGRFQQEWRDDICFLKSGIETRNPAFNQLIEQVEKVAARSVEPILLTGPTGAGKSQLANRIYELKKSRRRVTGEFVEVNCATLRGDSAMSSLFGHVRGAYTGATFDRPGLLRAADGGVLFLDEVGELGVDEQAMLLRAIEEKRFLPVGADRESRSDFQLICGTNRDLSIACGERRFRDDLLARINLWTFRLPGLRDRREDIEPNFDFELDRFSRRSGSRVSINSEARKAFLRFATSPGAFWSGNFRDLRGAVTRMATLASGGRITRQEVREEIALLAERWRAGRAEEPLALVEEVLGSQAAADLDLFDALQLAEVLRVCRNAVTMSEAGRELFQISRLKKKNTNDADRLRKYLAKFNLTWGQIGGSIP